MKINTEQLRLFLTKGLAIFPLLLIWQTKLIIDWAWPGIIRWEFNSLALYLSDIGLIILLIIGFILFHGSETKDKKRLWFYVAGLAVVFVSTFGIYTSFDKPLLVFNTLRIFGALSLTWLVINFADRKTLAQGFVIAAVICALIGWIQFASQTTVANKWLGLAEHQVSVPGVAVFITEQGRLLRAYGPLDHPNILGGLLALALIILAGYRLFKNYWLTFSLAILLTTGLFFSGSRSALLATGLGLVILLLNKNRKKYLGVATVVLLTGLSLSLVFGNLWSPRLSATGRLENNSINERQTQFSQALQTIQTHPLGVSSGQYTEWLAKQDNNAKEPSAYQPVHNIWLLTIAELGWLGGLAYLGLWLIPLLIIGRRPLGIDLALWLAIFILGCFDHWLYSNHFGLLLWALIIGLLLIEPPKMDKTLKIR
ncbi:hypothetical protein COT94_00685 [Candidatus Falkowbacteria bacterium CG10_big_fil_rev_8_21_14_0_10_37_14]|uniref:O-antigen ligase-related domain-containing protein n=1 Tax=Candidatus Falkowbacteria bacterium CG10_big_fil_rev_8_21_14_0_10_37_14 TaxID=1974561 RepID=A0A2M6WUJ5_9BACT|nr:O-antigen ligase family protein [Candidatus Falkowbacteria bacterium]PIT96463.1 MAG: hypothetical protein COT94_00685 [Candidatus Falkowbacteria bacterium CG10_big_fil_rev_8_21_14_0_10_37_14]